MFCILCVMLYLGVVRTNNLVQAYRKDESLYPSERDLSNPVKKLFKNVDVANKKLNIDNLIYGEVSEPYAYDYSEVWWTEKTKKEVKKTTIEVYHRESNGTQTTPTNNATIVTTNHVNMRETLKPTIIKEKIKVVDRLSDIKRKRPSQRNQNSNKVQMKKPMKSTTNVALTKKVQRDSEKFMYILNRDDAKGDLSINVNDTDIMVDARKNKSGPGVHASVISGLFFKNETVLSDFDYIIYDKKKQHGADASDESSDSYGIDLGDLTRTDGTAPIIIKVLKPEETAEGFEKFKKGAQMLIGPENTGNMPKVDREGIKVAVNMSARMPKRNVDPRYILKNQMPQQSRQSFKPNGLPNYNRQRYNQHFYPNSKNNPFHHNFNPNSNPNINQQRQNYNPNAPYGPHSFNKGQYGQKFRPNFNRNPYGQNSNRNPFGSNEHPNKGPYGPKPNPNSNRNPYGPNFPPNDFAPDYDSDIGLFGPPPRPHANRNPYGPNSRPNFNRNPFDPNFDPYKTPFGPSSRPNSNRNPYGPNFPPRGIRGPNGPNFPSNTYGNPFDPNFDPNKTPFGPSSRPSPIRNPYSPNFSPLSNRDPNGPNYPPNGNRNPYGPNVLPNAKINRLGPNSNPNSNQGPNGPTNFNRNFLNNNPNLNTEDNPFNQNYSTNPNGIPLNTTSKPKHNLDFIRDLNSTNIPVGIHGDVQDNGEGVNTNKSTPPFRDDTRQAKELEASTTSKEPTPNPSPDPHVDPEAFLPIVYEGMGFPGITEEVTVPTTTTKHVITIPRSTIDMHTDRVIEVETRPGGFGRRKTTMHPTFGTTPEKLSPYVHELLGLMVELNAGYFTAAAVSLLDTMALMPKKEARVLFSTYEVEVDTMINVDHSDDFGRDFIMALRRLAEYIGTNPVDFVQDEAKILHHAMLSRHESLTLDINSIIDYIDNIFEEEEGIKLFKVLEKVHDYPKGTITARLLHRELTDALYHPLIRLHQTAQKQILIDSINKLIANHMHAPVVGRRLRNLKMSTAPQDEPSDDLSDMNNYRYYKKRFKHYKRKIARTKTATTSSETRRLRNGTMSGLSTQPFYDSEEVSDTEDVVTKKAIRTTKKIKSTTSSKTPTLTTTSEVTTKMGNLKQKQNLLINKNKKRIQNATKPTTTTTTTTTITTTTITTTTTTTEKLPTIERAKMITTKKEKHKKKDSHHRRQIFIKKKKLRRLKSKHPKLFKKYFKRKKHGKHKKYHKKRLSERKLAKLNKIMQKFKSVERKYKGLVKKYTEKSKPPTSISKSRSLPAINDHQIELTVQDYLSYPRVSPKTQKPKKQLKTKPQMVNNNTVKVARKWQTTPKNIQIPDIPYFTVNPIFEDVSDDSEIKLSQKSEPHMLLSQKSEPDMMLSQKSEPDMMLSQKFKNFEGVVPKSKKTTSNKLVQLSSYSDEEAALKFNVYDAMRHDTTYLKGRRHNDETQQQLGKQKLGSSKSLNIPSSYSSEEVVLKSKIYEALAFNKDFVSNSSIEANTDNDKEFRANMIKILSRRLYATSYHDVSSYSDDEDLIRKNLNL